MSDRTKNRGFKPTALDENGVMESGQTLHNNFKVGIIILDHQCDRVNILFDGVRLTLRELGVGEQNVVVKYVPEPLNIPIATQFMAEYTEVDTVIILGCVGESDLTSSIATSLISSLNKIQLHWNMPCIWGVIVQPESLSVDQLFDSGVRRALEAIHMVRLQADMLAAAPGDPLNLHNVN